MVLVCSTDLAHREGAGRSGADRACERYSATMSCGFKDWDRSREVYVRFVECTLSPRVRSHVAGPARRLGPLPRRHGPREVGAPLPSALDSTPEIDAGADATTTNEIGAPARGGHALEAVVSPRAGRGTGTKSSPEPHCDCIGVWTRETALSMYWPRVSHPPWRRSISPVIDVSQQLSMRGALRLCTRSRSATGKRAMNIHNYGARLAQPDETVAAAAHSHGTLPTPTVKQGSRRGWERLAT